MSTHNKYERHKQVADEQARQQLQNCALLCAYVYGSAPGWYAITSGSIDGFRSDYAMVRSLAGDFEAHPVRAFYILGDEGYMDELNDIRAAVKEAHDMDELPPVATLTEEEKEAARLAVREALDEARPGDAESWLEGLCESCASDLIGTDWQAVVAAVRE